jgi:carbamoyl-phosphate synthase large subunit
MRIFKKLDFKIYSTEGTCKFLGDSGIESEPIKKVGYGRPDIVDIIKNGSVQLVINTPSGKESKDDDSYIRKSAIKYNVPYITTTAASLAAVKGIEARRDGEESVKSLQSYHADIT